MQSLVSFSVFLKRMTVDNPE